MAKLSGIGTGLCSFEHSKLKPMQFFKYLFKIFVIVLVFLLAVFFVSREYFLSRASNQLEKNLSQLLALKSTNATYQQCLELAGDLNKNSEEALFTLQLRFIDNKNYQLELVCQGFEFSPQLIATHTLPTGVTKLAGSSGFMLADGAWAINLLYQPTIIADLPLPKILTNRTKTFLVEDSKVVDKLTKEPAISTPTTLCAGYGFSCCDPIATLGQGETRPAADCRDYCYQTCLSRPMVLSFSAADYDQYAKRLTLSRNTPAQFFFSLSQQNGGQITVKIDFGDGQTWQGDQTQESVNHTYSCQTSSCQYQAKISLVDKTGVESQDSSVNTITVLIN